MWCDRNVLCIVFILYNDYSKIILNILVYLTMLFLIMQTKNIKWKGDKWMMNWKGFGRKQLWSNFKVLSWHSPGGTEKNHEKPQSGEPVSGPRFEPRTSKIRSRSVNHSTTTLGSNSKSFNKIRHISVLYKHYLGFLCRYSVFYSQSVVTLHNPLLYLLWKSNHVTIETKLHKSS
jgi:hypothetical protein